LLDEYLRERGRRDAVHIQIVMPFGKPIPPSPETSEAILERFAERGIEWIGERRVTELGAGEAILNDGTRLPFDLFLGIPRHRVPAVVAASGLADDGWVAVDPATLETRFPGVYAVGDVNSVGTPKAGVFAEGAAAAVADHLIAQIREAEGAAAYDGRGSCYIELGAGEVARVDVDFLSGPSVTGRFTAPSEDVAREKGEFASVRWTRWTGA
jgi:sulfide:quinone oxidoreductase